MNVWSITCLILAIPFLCIAIVFTLLREKGAIFISGFNTLPKEEQEQYDKKRMSRDMRNSLFLWCGVCLVGALLSYVLSNYFAMAALLICAILFIKEVHLTPEKAFGKYRKKEK